MTERCGHRGQVIPPRSLFEQIQYRTPAGISRRQPVKQAILKGVNLVREVGLCRPLSFDRMLFFNKLLVFGIPTRSSDEAHASRLSGVASRSNGIRRGGYDSLGRIGQLLAL
jgi:hypothetical protein